MQLEFSEDDNNIRFAVISEAMLYSVQYSKQ